MNLFITSSDPKKCARDLDDRRLVKSVLETAQILSTALRHHGCRARHLYRATHKDHPVTLWVMKTRGNYAWTLAYFRAACREYTRRFCRSHQCAALLDLFTQYSHLIPKGRRRRFCNCARNTSLGLDFTSLPVITAYRRYLAAKWGREHPGWTRGEAPAWRKVRRPIKPLLRKV